MEILIPPGDVLTRLQAAIKALMRADVDWDLTAPGAYLRVGALFHHLGAEIADCAAAGHPREAIRDLLTPIRAECARSPFIRRMQEWPRGYPGDFETIEHLLSQANQAPPGTLAWHLEAHSLGAAIAQQHRNKVTYQAHLLSNLLVGCTGAGTHPPDVARTVLILACGAAPDLRLVPTGIVRPQDRFVLNDIDAGALTRARDLLGPVAGNCAFVGGNILRNIARLAALGPYDLVLAGVLFDYLDDRAAQFLIKKALTRLCRPGGVFYFSNIAPDNPYRWWTEYIGDWSLIARSKTAVHTLLAPTAADIDDISIRYDPTGLTLLTQVRTARSRRAGPLKGST
ncbi:MAG: class I SAM-dependent methyltransferase [Pseudonocardiaceae bacterium]